MAIGCFLWLIVTDRIHFSHQNQSNQFCVKMKIKPTKRCLLIMATSNGITMQSKVFIIIRCYLFDCLLLLNSDHFNYQ